MPELTGDQLWCIRRALNESQGEFAKRLFLYQVRIFRMENQRDKPLKARDAHDILRIAAENGITVPQPNEASSARFSQEVAA